ncbi:hypothetical protein OH76DRAFT_1414841 [Lentinus brumalis]|uniref:Uncharacterized protein n=1 Tax=Lentinus brumalis TaxID=2498619 RepID=A0A371DSM0_9APHY|nr:hypothetical protein OH76DRAFT_1414841 [Polyporus brumalis]
MNPVPVPPHLMGTLMNYLQSQLPLQGHVQQAAPAAVAQMQAYPHMQLPAGVGPVFAGWQPWQPMQPGMVGSHQQWTAMPQQQVMQGQPRQVLAPQMSMNDLRAAAMQQQGRGSSRPPVGSHPNDEQTLLDALKKGRAGGFDPCQVLGKLHEVNGHTEMEWKNYFLEHLERFYPILYERRFEGPPAPAPQRRFSSSATQDVKATFEFVASHATPVSFAETRLPMAKLAAHPVVDQGHLFVRRLLPHLNLCPSALVPPRRHLLMSLPHESSSSATGSARLIWGDELVSEHAGVQVPVLPLRVKPKPPQKPEMSQATGRIGRFTDEEKIFFIQFLRWRLGRDGPVPTQRKLCRALSREAPHRSPDAWKHHWEVFPELPGCILELAEAKQRDVARTTATGNAGRAAIPVSDEEGQEAEAGEGEMQDEDSADGDEADDATYTSEDAAKPRRRKRKPRTGIVPQKVTAEDIRDMAKYKLDRLHEWDELKTHKGRWEDFSSEASHNTKRTIVAWIYVATTRKDEIDHVVQQLLDEQKADQRSSTERVPELPPPPTAASSSPSGRNSVNAEQTTGVLRKRDADSRLAVHDESPFANRVKQEPDTECISLPSDSDQLEEA